MCGSTSQAGRAFRCARDEANRPVAAINRSNGAVKRAVRAPGGACRPALHLRLRAEAPILSDATVAADGLRCFAAPSSFSSLPHSGRAHSGRPTQKGRTEMPVGKVKFFNAQKGYGFIAPEDGGSDAFVHISAVEKAGMATLNQDQRVSYELEQDRRGKTSAVNLQSA
jgi:CspA family cold shock protein